MTTLSLPSKNSASGKPVVTCLANIGLIYKHSNTESNESATLVHTSPLVCCTKLLVHYLDKRNCRERDRDRNNVDRLRGDNCRRHRNGTDCDTLRDDVSLYVLLALSGCCRLLRAIVRENSSSLDNDLRRYSLAGHWYSIRPLSRGVNTKSCGTLREDDLSRQYMHVLDDMTAFHWLANNPPIHFSWRILEADPCEPEPYPRAEFIQLDSYRIAHYWILKQAGRLVLRKCADGPLDFHKIDDTNYFTGVRDLVHSYQPNSW